MPNKILYFQYKSVHRNDNSIFFATNNDFFFLRIMNNTNNSWQNATICNLFSSLNYALFVHVVNVQKLFFIVKSSIEYANISIFRSQQNIGT